MRGSQKGVNREAPCRGGRRSHPGGRQGTPPESIHREKKKNILQNLVCVYLTLLSSPRLKNHFVCRWSTILGDCRQNWISNVPAMEDFRNEMKSKFSHCCFPAAQPHHILCTRYEGINLWRTSFGNLWSLAKYSKSRTYRRCRCRVNWFFSPSCRILPSGHTSVPLLRQRCQR